MRQYGEFSPVLIDGDLGLLFIDLANEVIEEVRAHPYAPSNIDEVSYYVALSDARPIHDAIIRSGILAGFAIQQMSDKASLYTPMFYRTMNRTLWQGLNGNTPIQMRITDGGTHPSHSAGLSTSATSGQTTPNKGS